MVDRVSEEMLRSLIEQVKAFHTTQISGFGYWKRGYDVELTPEDGPLFQLYAGLGVLTRDMWLYLKKNSREDAKLFQKVVRPVVLESQQKFPKTTIFRTLAQGELPEGFTAAAIEGHLTVNGLDDWRIVHENTTKPGKKMFYEFYRMNRDKFCGPGSPYELIRQGKLDMHELDICIAKVFQDTLSNDLIWQLLIAYLTVCALSKLETMCEMITILFLASDPTDASRLRLGEDFREIREKLQLSKLHEKFDLVERMSVRPADLSQAMLDVQPQIVHFSGHGTTTGALSLEDKIGRSHPIEPDALAALFEQFSGKVNCVVLATCYSRAHADAIARHINYVIGMDEAISDKAAIAFAIGFYQALGAGRKFEEAYRLGCVQIRLQNIPEHLTPVLVKKESAQV